MFMPIVLYRIYPRSARLSVSKAAPGPPGSRMAR
jgi:hypothetical protein